MRTYPSVLLVEFQGRSTIMMKNILLPLALCWPMTTLADNASLTAYFDNDSINPFVFVDAYETHTMGLRYQKGPHRYGLEAAIVSPDMIVYSNIYRVANRAYGEVLRLSYAYDLEQSSRDLEIGGYVTAVGEFGLDRIQQQLHDIFRLQDVFTQVQPVGMPDDVWFGITTSLTADLYPGSPYRQSYIGQLGTDRIALMAGLERDFALWGWDGTTHASLEAVFRDELISAPPIKAEFRTFVPRASIEVSKTFGAATITLGETLSLPTIASDDRLRAVFSAALTWKFE